MNKKNSQQNKSVSQSIWQKNGIPALEYCSLPRAAELLDCKVCDILHLSTVGAIQVGVLLKEGAINLVGVSEVLGRAVLTLCKPYTITLYW